jgi:hypothetical protein
MADLKTGLLEGRIFLYSALAQGTPAFDAKQKELAAFLEPEFAALCEKLRQRYPDLEIYFGTDDIGEACP